MGLARNPQAINSSLIRVVSSLKWSALSKDKRRDVLSDPAEKGISGCRGEFGGHVHVRILSIEEKEREAIDETHERI